MVLTDFTLTLYFPFVKSNRFSLLVEEFGLPTLQVDKMWLVKDTSGGLVGKTVALANGMPRVLL